MAFAAVVSLFAETKHRNVAERKHAQQYVFDIVLFRDEHISATVIAAKDL